MPTFKQHAAMMAAGAALAAMIFATPVAHAEPAPIDDASGPPTAGAPVEDGSGTPGPSFDEPVSIPSVGATPTKPGPNATPAQVKAYEAAVKEHDRQVTARMIAQAAEQARQEAKRYRDCINNNPSNTKVC